ncbi:unnamed protein product [Arctogadus glacialis]
MYLKYVTAVTNILSQVDTEEKVQALTVKLTFISEGCSKLMTALTILEGTHRPTAVSAYNIMEVLGSYLVNGTAKTCGFGAKTDELLRKIGVRERNVVLESLHDAFHFTKFSKHWDIHRAREVYRLHCVSREPLPTDMELAAYWRGLRSIFPRVAEVAVPYIYFPVSSVDCERSFSKYKTLLTGKREALTELNTKRLTILYFNGDVCDRWKS